MSCERSKASFMAAQSTHGEQMNKYYGEAVEMQPRELQPVEVSNMIDLLCQAPAGQVDPSVVLHFYNWKKLPLESLPNAIQETLDHITRENLASEFVVTALGVFKQSLEKRLGSQEVKT